MSGIGTVEALVPPVVAAAAFVAVVRLAIRHTDGGANGSREGPDGDDSP